MFMLKPAFRNRHCQVLNHDGYRVGSFIVYPFLTEKKAFAPRGRRRWATVWVLLCTTLYLTQLQSQHIQSFLCLQPTYLNSVPLPTTPSLLLFAHFSELYFSCIWPGSSGEKRFPSINAIVCRRPGSSQYRNIHFLDVKTETHSLKLGDFPGTKAGNYPQTLHLSRIMSGESGLPFIFTASAPLYPSSKQSRLWLAILAQMNIKIDAVEFFVPWMSTVSVSHCGFRKEGTSQTRSFWGRDGNW